MPPPSNPITFGKITASETREETPIPGTLYSFSTPLIYLGVTRGNLTAEFFVADDLQDAEKITFLEGRVGELKAGPRVRWDI